MSRTSKFFLLLLITSTSWAHADFEVHLGVVGTAPGVSRYGHAFLSVGHSKVPDFMWVTYDYSVRRRDGRPMEMADFTKDSEELRLRIEKHDFSTFEMAYRISQNLTLALIGISLSEIELKNLVSLLESYLAHPEQVVNLKYQPMGLNCVSRLIQLINKVVTPERRIPSILDRASLSQSSIFEFRSAISAGILNELPYGLIAFLKRSPLFSGDFKILPSRQQSQILDMRIILERMEEVRRQCDWQAQTAQLLASRLALSLKNPQTYSATEPIEQAIAICPRQKSEFAQILLLFSRLLIREDHYPFRQQWMEYSANILLRAGEK